MSDATAGTEMRAETTMDLAVKIGLTGLLIYWCFDIVQPFIAILIWAGILAVVLYPLFILITRWFGGRSGLAATVMTVVLITALLGPTATLGTLLVQDLGSVLEMAKDGSIEVPPPPESIRDWPLVGSSLYDVWSSAANNLAATIKTIEPELRSVVETILSALLGAGLGALQFVASLAVAGFLVTKSAASHSFSIRFAEKLVAGNGAAQVQMIEDMVRNVSRGVIGTALIQTFFVMLGLFVAGIPGAALWTVVCLVLSIVQIGPAPVIVGTMIYLGFEASTLTTVIYVVYMIPVMLIDNILKPILMGKGSQLPVALILAGVIGGTLAYGIVGVFIGPVVLALGYACLYIWLNGGTSEKQQASS